MNLVRNAIAVEHARTTCLGSLHLNC